MEQFNFDALRAVINGGTPSEQPTTPPQTTPTASVHTYNEALQDFLATPVIGGPQSSPQPTQPETTPVITVPAEEEPALTSDLDRFRRDLERYKNKPLYGTPQAVYTGLENADIILIADSRAPIYSDKLECVKEQPLSEVDKKFFEETAYIEKGKFGLQVKFYIKNTDKLTYLPRLLDVTQQNLEEGPISIDRIYIRKLVKVNSRTGIMIGTEADVQIRAFIK